MLTVALIAGDEAAPLVATFRALMPAVLEGIVAGSFVVSRASQLAPVCEGVGAALVAPEAAREAVERSDAPWLLVLRAGSLPRDDWVGAVMAHVAGGGGSARLEPYDPDRSLWRRLTGWGGDPLAGGLLIERGAALASLRNGTLEGLAAGRAVRTLPARLATMS